MTSSEGFQQHFSIISKSVCCDLYMKKNVAFALISFAVLKCYDCLSVQLPFELPVQITVQLSLELEANWLDQNVNELEFELECRWNNPEWPEGLSQKSKKQTILFVFIFFSLLVYYIIFQKKSLLTLRHALAIIGLFQDLCNNS